MAKRRCAVTLGLTFATCTASAFAQPGFPPNDPDSWRVAGTAKILCSALFVSGRDSAEALAHVTPYFLGPKVDSGDRADGPLHRHAARHGGPPARERAAHGGDAGEEVIDRG